MTLSTRLIQATLLAFLSLFLFAGQANAAPWYQVEIIVFAQAKGSYHNSESWSQDLVLPDFTNARALDPAGSGTAFRAIDERHFRLQREWNKLENSSEYKPLIHMGWQQPGLPSARAVGVLVEAGAASPALGGAKPLSGVISVSLSRYLHLDANLLYRKAIEKPVEGGPTFETYQLNESRRMRSHERHYLDQPMFGVIALITPL